MMPARTARGRFKQKQVDEGLRLDTDVLIFDRITYDATRALLDYAKESPALGNPNKHAIVVLDETDSLDVHDDFMKELPDSLVQMVKTVDAFHTIFVTAHGAIDELTAQSSHDLQSDLQVLHFRLLLLRVTVLFIARHASSAACPLAQALFKLRHANQMRAVSWGANVGPEIRVFPVEVLSWYRTTAGNEDDQVDEESEMLDDNSDPDQAGSDDEAQHLKPPRLTDILPFFIQLTAVRSAEDEGWHTTERWLRLAAEFMRQAALERLLESTRGANESVIVEAFAWGVEGSHDAHSGIRDDNAVLLLTDETSDQSESTWSKLRTRYLNELLPPRASTTEESNKLAVTRAHLDGLRKRHPLATFEKMLLSFLDGLCESYPRPILSQLEAADDKDGDENEEENTDKHESALLVDGEQIQPEDREILMMILQGRAQ